VKGQGHRAYCILQYPLVKQHQYRLH